MSAAVKISDREFESLSGELYKLTGIALGESKKNLAESRLSKRLGQLHLNSFEQYLEKVRRSPQEQSAFIEAMTTHKTHWFREAMHFDLLPKRRDSESDEFYFWSAAASTGEEAYSVAIDLIEKGWTPQELRILGTDVSSQVLDVARRGTYKKSQVLAECGPEILSRYFTSTGNTEVKVKSEIATPVKFRPFNLIETNRRFGVLFDLVFLRNVLIYFDEVATQQAIENVTRHLRPGGLLAIGVSETLQSLPAGWVSLGHSVYRWEGRGNE